MDAKRGYVPEDERNFSPESIETMRTASRHILYLLEESYDLKQALRVWEEMPKSEICKQKTDLGVSSMTTDLQAVSVPEITGPEEAAAALKTK